MPEQHAYTINGHRFVADHVLTAEEARALQAKVGGPPPPTEPSTGARFLRGFPAMAGMIRGGQVGGELGAPLGLPGIVGGALVGAGVGAGGAEGALALAQRALGLPEGKPPIVPRVEGAAESGTLGELTGRVLAPVLGPPARYVGGKLGRAAGYVGRRIFGAAPRVGVPLGVGEAAGRGETIARMGESRLGRWLLKGPARRQSVAAEDAVRARLAEMGGPLTKADFAENLQGSARRYLARVERNLKALEEEPPAMSPMERATQPSRLAEETAGWKQAAAAERERLAPVLGSMREIVGKTMSTARIVTKLAKDPGYLTKVAQELGPESMQELQRAWLTGTLVDGATATARRGVLNTAHMADAFEALGEQGQEALFGARVGPMRELFGALRSAKASATLAAGESSSGRGLLHMLQRIVLPSSVGAAYGYHHGGGGKGAAAGAILGATVPLVWGRILVQQGGPEFLTAVVAASQDSGLMQKAMPGLLRVGGQLVARAMQNPEGTPPTGTTTTTIPAMPTTTTTMPLGLRGPTTTTTMPMLRGPQATTNTLRGPQKPQTYPRPFPATM